MLRRFSLFSFLLIVGLNLAAETVSVQTADSIRMLRLIPDPLPASGLAQAAPSFYDPDNLYQYMDGGADIFVLYGVQSLLHMDVKMKTVDLTVDIFDMGSPNTAFGMYASERSPDYQFISMGAEGYRNTGVLNFFQDRYYVKLAGFGDGADAVLDSFAHAISAKIGGDSRFPALLDQLPVENRKTRSEQYIPNDPLGHPFLGPALAASYTAGDQESKLYVTLANDGADARQRMKKLVDHFAKTGECKSAPELGDDAIRGGNSFEGRVIARTRGRYLILLMNPAAGGDELLKQAAERLQ